MDDRIWFLRTQDETFGPETRDQLVAWAKLGRIQPGQEISDDNVIWRRVEDVPFLDMRFSIDIGDGNPRGPFNREAAAALLASGRLPQGATLVEVREPFAEECAAPAEPDESPAPAEPDESPAPETPRPQDLPAPEIVEKVVEVPVEVEKIVEKIVEKRVEIPVEVEKIVVDETRVKELEGLLAEERRHTTDLQERMDSASRSAAEASRQWTERAAAYEAAAREAAAREHAANDALKDAAAREEKLVEQVRHLEDELRRLPQAASEVADIQAAVYSIMTGEAEELAKMIEAEKREAEAFRRRHEERAERLLERRRALLKRAGTNIEDMTRKALVERPEDPRTTQLRREYEDFRRASEKLTREQAQKLDDLAEQLRIRRAEGVRAAEGARDLTELRREVQTLKELLQVREKDLMAERQKCEALRQQQAVSQQTMLARLATLESPSIGTAKSVASNQSREAKLVKLPHWMRIGS